MTDFESLKIAESLSLSCHCKMVRRNRGRCYSLFLFFFVENVEKFPTVNQVNNVSGELTLLKNRQLPSKGISSLKIRPDGKILVAGSWDSTIRLFSWLKPQNLKPLGALKFHENAIDAIDVTSKLIAAGSSDGYVTIWNVYNKD